MRAHAGVLTRVRNQHLHLEALRSTDDAGEATVRAVFPLSIHGDGAHPKAIRDRVPVNISHALSDPAVNERGRSIARAFGYQSMVVVPLLRHDVSIGTISATRREPGGFTGTDIALLQTFADQAVIAIENVRLFKELESSNRQLTTALEQQTATAEILRVISSSPTDIQPVLDRMAESAARFCQAYDATIFRANGDELCLVAHHGAISSLPLGSIIPLTPAGVATRAVLERRPIHVADIELEADEFPVAAANARALGNRTMLAVPLLHEQVALGAILLRRIEPDPFTDKQIELLNTFADQAVIAIENVRLFKELEARNADLSEALEQQTATGEILRAISRSPTNLQPVLDTIARLAALVCDAVDAMVQLREGEVIRIVAHFGPIARSVPHTRVLARAYATGRAILDREPFQIRDIEAPEADEFDQYRDAARRTGFRTLIAVPMLREGVAIGALTIRRREPQPFTDKQTALLQTFADQAVIAIENVRLFNELGAANRDLQAASQHKSEFLANMSHELRTPLNAIIGFSEVLTERMFGEVNEKQYEYLKDIYASGQHLLSLINDILDLSKIEAGRMELELADFHLPQAIDNAVVLVRERALRRGITLEQSIDPSLGGIQGDERKIKQVLLNLLSNAIKFTGENGRIDVRAALNETMVQVSVADSGVGIAPEHLEAVFEEFRQVGTAEKKAEGTGLGLALARKFVELHGGRIWVQSQVGAGSTFTFTIPVRHGD
jgi:signal transduction histidine kinase